MAYGVRLCIQSPVRVGLNRVHTIEVAALHVEDHLTRISQRTRQVSPAYHLVWNCDGKVCSGPNNQTHVAARVEIRSRREHAHRIVGQSADSKSTEVAGPSADGLFQQCDNIFPLHTVEGELLRPLREPSAAGAGLVHREGEYEADVLRAVIGQEVNYEFRYRIE